MIWLHKSFHHINQVDNRQLKPKRTSAGIVMFFTTNPTVAHSYELFSFPLLFGKKKNRSGLGFLMANSRVLRCRWDGKPHRSDKCPWLTEGHPHQAFVILVVKIMEQECRDMVSELRDEMSLPQAKELAKVHLKKVWQRTGETFKKMKELFERFQKQQDEEDEVEWMKQLHDVGGDIQPDADDFGGDDFEGDVDDCAEEPKKKEGGGILNVLMKEMQLEREKKLRREADKRE